MTYSKILGVCAAVVVLAAGFFVSTASAQTQLWCGTYWATECAASSVRVYVLVQNPFSGVVRAPSDFTMHVLGTHPTPQVFAGSQSGVHVALGAGAFEVRAVGDQHGYSASYSAGCTGVATHDRRDTCVVTMSGGPSYVVPGGYPAPSFVPQPLTCVPQNQTTGLGTAARFTAVGGNSSVYDWATPSRTFLKTGPVLNTTFSTVGMQTVTVTSGTATATCVVTVVPGYVSPGTAHPVYPTYPQLPNTGVAPISAAQAASALMALLVVAVFGAPYVRKAFAIVSR